MKRLRRRVCFVTGELHPLTPGGIGRLVSNLIRDAQTRRAPVDFHLLLPSWSPLEVAAVEAVFDGRVTCHRAAPLGSAAHQERHGAAYPPRLAFTDTPNHADSLELMLELQRLEEGGLHFDVIEFPDYLGWAFCTLQQRRQGLAFAASTVAVRLHSTDGVVQRFEGVTPTLARLGTHELERLALEDADVVVGHLAAIADFNARFYGFDEGWRRRVLVEFPPIGEPTARASRPEAGARNRPLVFVTKLQQIKRPDLFVRGVALYMAAHPEYRGQALFACHAPSADFAQQVYRLVPPRFAERFLQVGPGPRDALMGDGVVVIPSEYESLNLSAYEAAARGATLVLNGACPAFAPGSPFVDGVNCVLFDGTPEGLVTALERALASPPQGRVEAQAELPYFERPLPSRPPLSKLNAAKVSVLITNHNLAAWLPRAIESVAASTWDNVELVIVDDASTEPLDAQVLDALEVGSAGLPVKVVRNVVNRGLSASRNIGLRHCSGDFVLPLDADDRVAPGFIAQAVRALTLSPGFDVVVPTTGYFRTDEALERREYIDYACFLGGVPTLGLMANRFSTATALMRREVLARFGYDEGLDSFEDWSLYLRMSHAGVRFLVTNDIGFHYRRRENSMVRGVAPERRRRLLSRLHDGLPRPLPPSVALRFLVLLEGERPTPERARPEVPVRYRMTDLTLSLWREVWGAPPAGEPRPPLHQAADQLNAAIKRYPRLHRALRAAAILSTGRG